MTSITAQVSLYPLRKESLSPVIEEALLIFRVLNLNVELGVMSTSDHQTLGGPFQDIISTGDCWFSCRQRLRLGDVGGFQYLRSESKAVALNLNTCLTNSDNKDCF
jgi:hypothetical protein